MVFINYGSVFDSKCDLLILPCSSTGRVTSWVNQAIINHNLNFTYKSIPYGKVLFIRRSRYGIIPRGLPRLKAVI